VAILNEKAAAAKAVSARRRTAKFLLEQAQALGYSLPQLQKAAKIDPNSLKNIRKAAPQTRTLYRVAQFIEQEQRRRLVATA
jgi:hypothetical protein